MLLIKDDSLINRIDQFIVGLDRFNRMHDEGNWQTAEGETLYKKLSEEAREIIKELWNHLIESDVQDSNLVSTIGNIRNLTKRWRGTRE